MFLCLHDCYIFPPFLQSRSFHHLVHHFPCPNRRLLQLRRVSTPLLKRLHNHGIQEALYNLVQFAFELRILDHHFAPTLKRPHDKRPSHFHNDIFHQFSHTDLLRCVLKPLLQSSNEHSIHKVHHTLIFDTPPLLLVIPLPLYYCSILPPPFKSNQPYAIDKPPQYARHCPLPALPFSSLLSHHCSILPPYFKSHYSSNIHMTQRYLVDVTLPALHSRQLLL
mmetsp:Transcript_38987/g.62831  ORF Transcript_38987/g.62831 Transcript_38987/m.62831 type:complete len:222 (-) Transcript_38987:238-903(-)